MQSTMPEATDTASADAGLAAELHATQRVVDALAAIGDRFGTLLALVARTEALLAAERFVRRRL